LQKISEKYFQTIFMGSFFKASAGILLCRCIRSNDLNFSTNDSAQITSRGAVTFLRSSIRPDDKVEYPGLGKLAGFGWGFDLGFNGKINDRWSVGLSLTDIGYMNWYGNNNEYKYAGEFVVTDLAKSEQLDTLRTLY
jgi:hypothetical protein